MINLTVYTAVTCTYGSRKPTHPVINNCMCNEYFWILVWAWGLESSSCLVLVRRTYLGAGVSIINRILLVTWAYVERYLSSFYFIIRSVYMYFILFYFFWFYNCYTYYCIFNMAHFVLYHYIFGGWCIDFYLWT